MAERFLIHIRSRCWVVTYLVQRSVALKKWTSTSRLHARARLMSAPLTRGSELDATSTGPQHFVLHEENRVNICMMGNAKRKYMQKRKSCVHHTTLVLKILRTFRHHARPPVYAEPRNEVRRVSVHMVDKHPFRAIGVCCDGLDFSPPCINCKWNCMT